jgi:hypothetical protein
MGKATDEELTSAIFDCAMQCLKAPDRAQCVAATSRRLCDDKGWAIADCDTVADGALRVFDLMDHRSPAPEPG